MQQIWARILAGEVARPKSFSPRTLSIVRDLTTDDATLFKKLCGLCWFVPGAGFVPIVHDVDAESIEKAGVTLAGLTHLTSIGLIEFNGLSGFALSKSDGFNEIHPRYCGQVFSLKADGAPKFPLGNVLLTAAGQELLQIAGAEGNDDFRDHALDGWEKQGWKSAKPAGGSEASSIGL